MGHTNPSAPPLWRTLCDLLEETSRTFAVGIRALPVGLRHEVTVAYLILRVSDYLEDNAVMAPEAKAEALRRWRSILHGQTPVEELLDGVTVDATIPDAQALLHAEVILRGLAALNPAAADAIVRHTGDSTEGMAVWTLRGPDFPGESDLDDYMHEVAGRVGYLLTDLFAVRYPEIDRRKEAMLPLARQFGLALQTVNVIRGLSSDHRRGWVFLPRTFLPPGVDFPALLAQPRSEASLALLDRLEAKAAGHLAAAQEYIGHLPRGLWGVRVFCLVPYFLALRTLTLSSGNPQVFTDEVKVPRSAVRAIVTRSRILGFSNAWVARYARSLARP